MILPAEICQTIIEYLHYVDFSKPTDKVANHFKILGRLKVDSKNIIFGKYKTAGNFIRRHNNCHPKILAVCFVYNIINYPGWRKLNYYVDIKDYIIYMRTNKSIENILKILRFYRSTENFVSLIDFTNSCGDSIYSLGNIRLCRYILSKIGPINLDFARPKNYFLILCGAKLKKESAAAILYDKKLYNIIYLPNYIEEIEKLLKTYKCIYCDKYILTNSKNNICNSCKLTAINKLISCRPELFS